MTSALRHGLGTWEDMETLLRSPGHLCSLWQGGEMGGEKGEQRGTRGRERWFWLGEPRCGRRMESGPAGSAEMSKVLWPEQS